MKPDLTLIFLPELLKRKLFLIIPPLGGLSLGGPLSLDLLPVTRMAKPAAIVAPHKRFKSFIQRSKYETQIDQRLKAKKA